MSGGDDGVPSPLHGGEFLLQLLRNPPQQPRQPQPQNMSHDPAVAAVGPSVGTVSPSMYQNSSHNQLPYNGSSWSHSPPQFAPHNFFLQNPNPNIISASPPLLPGFDQYMSHNHQYSVNSTSLGADNVIKMETFTKSRPVLAPQQQQEVQSDLMFGSFDMRNNAGVSNLNSNHFRSSDVKDVNLRNRVQNGLEIEFQKSLDLNRNNNLHGNSRWGPAPGRRPPPGFSSNAGSVTNRSGSFEQNMSKGKSKTGDLKHRNVSAVNHIENERGMGQRMSGEIGLRGQLDYPGLPSGSEVHLAKALDVEESQTVLRSQVRADRMRREDDQVKSEVVDSECIVDPVLEDNSSDKEDKKKEKVTRDKEYRSDKRGQWILNQRMRISKRRIECRSDIYRLNNPFLEIYESLIPSDEERAKQKQLLSLLEKHVNNEWPGARLYLYGSCANSFGFKKSDIDVCLAIDDTDVNKSEVLLKLAEILQSDNLQNVQALTRARVPIVKLKDPVTGIACDICVNNLLAVINTKLLRDYALIDKRLRQLAFIIKHWAKSRGVNETYQGTLSSYAYVLMCINFLQQRKPAVLPCLQRMERTYAVNVDNAECAYFDQVDKLIGFGSQNRETIARLVWEFFNYWAYYHDYTNEVISVRAGRTISKHEKDWTRRVGNDRHLICIEDPFEISHDLGRVVDKHSIRVLREEFERAAEIMQYSPDPCVDLFKPYLPS